MRHHIARALGACLRSILTAALPAAGPVISRGSGRHRAPSTARHRAAHTAPAAVGATLLPEDRADSGQVRSPYAEYNADPVPLVGEETALVRPFVVAYERALVAQGARVVDHDAERLRRIAVAAALDGIDLGPDVIHGVRLPLNV